MHVEESMPSIPLLHLLNVSGSEKRVSGHSVTAWRDWFLYMLLPPPPSYPGIHGGCMGPMEQGAAWVPWSRGAGFAMATPERTPLESEIIFTGTCDSPSDTFHPIVLIASQVRPLHEMHQLAESHPMVERMSA